MYLMPGHVRCRIIICHYVFISLPSIQTRLQQGLQCCKLPIIGELLLDENTVNDL